MSKATLKEEINSLKIVGVFVRVCTRVHRCAGGQNAVVKMIIEVGGDRK